MSNYYDKLLYSLKDCVAGNFGPVLMAINDQDAQRMVRLLFLTSKNNIADYPGDYQLYRIGEFNLENGHLDGYTAGPEFICNVVDLV